MNIFRGCLLGMLLLAGCASSVRSPARPTTEVRELRRVELGTLLAAVGRDGDGLLGLDGAGIRLIRFDSLLAATETIPLSSRLASPRGCAADRFYFYVYDQGQLYRMQRPAETLAVWLAGVRAAGLATYAAGEMLVADENTEAVYHKSVFGSSRRLLQASAVPRPGAMAALPGGRFAVISRPSRLVLFDRAGVVQSSFELPSRCDLLAADEAGMLFLAISGEPALWRLVGGRLSGFALPPGTSPTGLVADSRGVVVLDAGRRLVRLELPAGD
jgi:hypothetical protein